MTKTDAEIYAEARKRRWPYVDEPRPMVDEPAWVPAVRVPKPSPPHDTALAAECAEREAMLTGMESDGG